MHVVASKVEGAPQAVSATRIAIIVALAHGLNDAYASFIPPLLLRIMDDMGLSITLAATLAVTSPSRRRCHSGDYILDTANA